MARNQRDAAPEGAAGKAKTGTAAGDRPSAAQVAGYLRRHPAFLAEHPELLEVLAPPGRTHGDGVLDLQSFMVERLRGEVAEMREARDALVRSGRSNMAAQGRVHEAVLALLASKSFEHLIEIVTTDLAILLNLDAVSLGVEQAGRTLPPVRLGGLCQLEPDTVDSLIGSGRKVALRGEIEGDPAIFGAAAGLVASQALIRLDISAATPPALLALGSRQAGQFHPGQGTELLAFLAGALEHCIRAWLDLPA
jgi:uncharacterized protein YigA (DUF484 family)